MRTINLKPKQITVEQGILFEKNTVYNSFSLGSVDNFIMSTEVFQKKHTGIPLFNTGSYIFYIELIVDQEMEVITIQFPKLGNILAEVQSIISIVMLLSVFGYLYSQYKQEQMMAEALIERNNLTDIKCNQVGFFRFLFINRMSIYPRGSKINTIFRKKQDITHFLPEFEKYKKAVQFLYTPKQWALMTRAKKYLLLTSDMDDN